MSRSVAEVLRWPLWSWRNLVVTVVGALLVVAALGRVSGASGGSDAASPAPSSTSSAPGTTSPTSDDPSSSSDPTTSDPTSSGATSSSDPTSTSGGSGEVADEEATETAAATKARARAGSFLRAWLTPGTPKARTAALSMIANPRLVAQLAGLPAEALPKAAGRPAVISVDQAVAVLTVAMSDGRTAVLTMTAERDGWMGDRLSTTGTPPTPPASSTATSSTASVATTSSTSTSGAALSAAG